VPLQQATLANGCMHFVPQSHNLDVLTHRPINNDPRIHGLELDPSEMHRTEHAVACPLAPGGCTIHGGYTLHYAPPNRSDIPRRALILGIDVPAEEAEGRPETWPWLASRQTARSARAKAAGKADIG
jgi:ectoine hydroxylase-related dioxygenase (phytanoyl-CoA dioxygenase family)